MIFHIVSDELAERDPLQHERKRHQSQLSEKIQDKIRSDCPEIIVIDDDSRDNDSKYVFYQGYWVWFPVPKFFSIS